MGYDAENNSEIIAMGRSFRLLDRDMLFAVLGCACAFAVLGALEGARFIQASIRDNQLGDLLVYAEADPSGARLVADRSPKFSKPTTHQPAAWRSWQERLRHHLTEAVYDLDFSSAPVPSPKKWLQRETTDGGLNRREFSIPAADGDLIPAVLLLPADTDGPLPGVMLLPGHVREHEHESGLGQLVLPVDSYQHSAARKLAQAGFATLTIELRGFGMRGPPNFPEHSIVAYNAILAGSFYKKVMFDDIMRAFDLFVALPETDDDRIGLSGASLGGELAVEYAALDARVKAVSFHSHGGGVGPYQGQSDAAAEQPHYCHIIPGSNGILHQEDPFLLLAPRPVQGIRGDEEAFFQEEFVESLQRVWWLMDGSAAIELQVAPGGHGYFVDAAIRFFRKHLAETTNDLSA
jgi:dienelactone hydrolase